MIGPMPGLEGIFSDTGLKAMSSTGEFNTAASFDLGNVGLLEQAKARIAEYRRKSMVKQGQITANSAVWDGALGAVGDIASARIGAAGKSFAAKKAFGTTAQNLDKYAPLS